MARPVEGVTREDIDATRYDDMSFVGTYGPVGVTVFLPSARQIGLYGDPDLLCPYSAGWGEGLGAARTAAEAITRTANAMSVVVEYPKQRLAVSQILGFRRTVFGEVIRHLREHTIYDTATTVVVGYSRGTAPARLAAIDHADIVTGLVLVAPTWFTTAITPTELAQRGIAEGAGAMVRSGWLDRINLVGASVRLAQEMLTHPWDLRNDITAISQESAADLDEIVATGLRVGVVGGRQDELCEVADIRQIIARVSDPDRVDYREVDSDHFSYFLRPSAARIVADVIATAGA